MRVPHKGQVGRNQDLPRRWLKAEWVNQFSVEPDFGEDSSKVHDGVISKPDMFLWIKERYYPQVTHDQYRIAIKRLIQFKGPGYSSVDRDKLIPEVQRLLHDRIEELGRTTWGFKAGLRQGTSKIVQRARKRVIDLEAKRRSTSKRVSNGGAQMRAMQQRHEGVRHIDLGKSQLDREPLKRGFSNKIGSNCENTRDLLMNIPQASENSVEYIGHRRNVQEDGCKHSGSLYPSSSRDSKQGSQRVTHNQDSHRGVAHDSQGASSKQERYMIDGNSHLFGTNQHGDDHRLSANQHGDDYRFSANQHGDDHRFNTNQHDDDHRFSANQHGDDHRFNTNQDSDDHRFSSDQDNISYSHCANQGSENHRANSGFRNKRCTCNENDSNKQSNKMWDHDYHIHEHSNEPTSRLAFGYQTNKSGYNSRTSFETDELLFHEKDKSDMFPQGETDMVLQLPQVDNEKPVTSSLLFVNRIREQYQTMQMVSNDRNTTVPLSQYSSPRNRDQASARLSKVAELDRFRATLLVKLVGKSSLKGDKLRQAAIEHEKYIKTCLDNQNAPLGFFAIEYDHTLPFWSEKFVYCSDDFVKSLGASRTDFEWRILSEDDLQTVTSLLSSTDEIQGILRIGTVRLEPYSSFEPVVYANLTLEFIPEGGIFGWFVEPHTLPYFDKAFVRPQGLINTQSDSQSKQFGLRRTPSSPWSSSIWGKKNDSKYVPYHLLLKTQELKERLERHNAREMSGFTDAYVVSILSSEIEKRSGSTKTPSAADLEIAVDFAFEKLRKSQQWRTEIGLANVSLSEARFKHCLDEGYIYWYGYDNIGHPILWYRVSLADYHKRPRDGVVDFHYLAHMLDHGVKYFFPPGITKFTLIADLANFGSHNANPQTMLSVMKMFVTGFPDRFHRVITVPVSIFQMTCWMFMKPFAARSFKDKFQFYRKLDAKTLLDNDITMDNIWPTAFGGKMEHNHCSNLQKQTERQLAQMQAFLESKNGRPMGSGCAPTPIQNQPQPHSQSMYTPPQQSNLSPVHDQSESPRGRLSTVVQDGFTDTELVLGKQMFDVNATTLSCFRYVLRQCLPGATRYDPVTLNRVIHEYEEGYLKRADAERDFPPTDEHRPLAFTAFRFNFEVGFGGLECVYCNEDFVTILGADRSSVAWVMFSDLDPITQELSKAYQKSVRMGTSRCRIVMDEVGLYTYMDNASTVSVKLVMETDPSIGVLMWFREVLPGDESDDYTGSQQLPMDIQLHSMLYEQHSDSGGQGLSTFPPQNRGLNHHRSSCTSFGTSETKYDNCGRSIGGSFDQTCNSSLLRTDSSHSFRTATPSGVGTYSPGDSEDGVHNPSSMQLQRVRSLRSRLLEYDQVARECISPLLDDAYLLRVIIGEEVETINKSCNGVFDAVVEQALSKLRDARNLLHIGYGIQFSNMLRAKESKHMGWLPMCDNSGRPIFCLSLEHNAVGEAGIASDLGSLAQHLEDGQKKYMLNTGITQFVMLFDFAKASKEQINNGFLMEAIDLIANGFPHRLGRAFWGPGSPVVHATWSLVKFKPNVRRTMTRKVVVVDHFRDPALAKLLNVDELQRCRHP